MEKQPVTVTLPLEQWNTILTILAQQRFDVVVGIIGDIQRQASAQIAPDEAGPAN